MTVATTSEIWPVQLRGNQWQTNTANSQTLQVSSSHLQSCESIFAVQYFSSDRKNGKRENTDAWLFSCGAEVAQCRILSMFHGVIHTAAVQSVCIFPVPRFVAIKATATTTPLIWNCTSRNKSVTNEQGQMRNNHNHEQNLSGTASICILYVPDFCHHSYHWDTTTALQIQKTALHEVSQWTQSVLWAKSDCDCKHLYFLCSWFTPS